LKKKKSRRIKKHIEDKEAIARDPEEKRRLEKERWKIEDERNMIEIEQNKKEDDIKSLRLQLKECTWLLKKFLLEKNSLIWS